MSLCKFTGAECASMSIVACLCDEWPTQEELDALEFQEQVHEELFKQPGD